MKKARSRSRNRFWDILDMNNSFGTGSKLQTTLT